MLYYEIIVPMLYAQTGRIQITIFFIDIMHYGVSNLTQLSFTMYSSLATVVVRVVIFTHRIYARARTNARTNALKHTRLLQKSIRQR